MKIENKKAYIPCEIAENEINNGLDIRVRIDKTHDLYINRKLLIPDIDQPKLKIPQFILDWVDDSREHGYEFDEWFYYSNQPLEVYKWLNTKNKRQKELNALALVTLIVNGPDAVIVEKEKLYTVEIPTNSEAKLALVRREDKKIVITIVGERWRRYDSFQLTEQEIRKDFDWAWQFAKEVTE
ncbi:DUF1642 domain-containing protein [Streptococcus uberis]|uniref:DUF1642 domain-containing protein n=1 Tax=Streptococcus uberis TaxID=1349 RepID=UPI001939F746|nr:DUF1642 domain-containing protein [Streptococcus uberis]